MPTTAYRYPHFTRELLTEFMTFHDSPAPGDQMPDFDLPTTGGSRVSRTDFIGKQPFLLTTASVTCPMTATADPILRDLHDEFGDRIAFVSLYVVEAHPGDQIPQPESFEQKLEHAKLLKTRDLLPWPVAVDDIEGSLHRQLDRLPNAAWLVGSDGRVLFRSLWTNARRDLHDALKAVAGGRPVPHPERKSHVEPMLRAAGVSDNVLDLAGPVAKDDVRREALPIYVMGRLAAAFKPLPPLGRGTAAALTVAAAATLVVWGGARLVSRLQDR